jgi:hypothetical protein
MGAAFAFASQIGPLAKQKMGTDISENYSFGSERNRLAS